MYIILSTIINNSEVSMVLNDLIGELEKVELAGDYLVRSILHDDDVVDKAVSLHEWERSPFGAARGGFMIPSSWLPAGEARSYGAGGCAGEKGCWHGLA